MYQRPVIVQKSIGQETAVNKVPPGANGSGRVRDRERNFTPEKEFLHIFRKRQPAAAAAFLYVRKRIPEIYTHLFLIEQEK